jgi:hypothetical protein
MQPLLYHHLQRRKREISNDIVENSRTLNSCNVVELKTNEMRRPTILPGFIVAKLLSYNLANLDAQTIAKLLSEVRMR